MDPLNTSAYALGQKPYAPRLGSYVTITNHPRIDCIGKVTHVAEEGTRFEVTVPNWTADGQPHRFYADVWTVAKATAAQARAAAKAR